MFKTGDYIVHGTGGVCRVDQVGPLDVSGTTKGKIYYTLLPVYREGSRIFTPADNSKVIMRPVIEKDAANFLIDHIKEVDLLWIDDEKKREEVYRDAMRQCDCREWVKIIKTLYHRRKSREAAGKKMTSSDEKVLREAEDNLYGELAVALDVEKNQIEDLILSRAEEQTEN